MHGAIDRRVAGIFQHDCLRYVHLPAWWQQRISAALCTTTWVLHSVGSTSSSHLPIVLRPLPLSLATAAAGPGHGPASRPGGAAEPGNHSRQGDCGAQSDCGCPEGRERLAACLNKGHMHAGSARRFHQLQLQQRMVCCGTLNPERAQGRPIAATGCTAIQPVSSSYTPIRPRHCCC